MPAPEASPARPRHRAGSWLLLSGALLFAASLPLSIAVAESALVLTALGWLLAGGRQPCAAGEPRPRSPLWAPALAYSLLTLAAAAASPRPLASLADCKELLLFAVLLVLPKAVAASGSRLGSFFLLGAGTSALWGLTHYLASPGGLEYRERGPYGHYMTWAGVLMLAATLALARLLATDHRRRIQVSAALAVLLVLLVAGLETSYSRNAWLGLGAGTLVVALALRPRALLAIAVLLALVALTAPTPIHGRAASIFALDENRDRLEMARFGVTLIAAHPLLGIGPNQVPAAYAAHPELTPHPHLHNNALQIAAERGLPALAAWIWLIAAALLTALRRLRRSPGSAGPAAGLGALAALLVAGLFEYNFGDSEVKLALLLLVVLALHEPGSERSGSEPL